MTLPVRLGRRLASRRARRGRLRAGLGLAPRERLLDAARGPDGGYALAATDRALYHRARGGAWTRLGWETIAAERITHTRLGSWRVTPPAGRLLLVEARRRPVTGEVLWFVGPGTSRPEAERVIARLGARTGLPPRSPVTLPWR